MDDAQLHRIIGTVDDVAKAIYYFAYIFFGKFFIYNKYLHMVRIEIS